MQKYGQHFLVNQGIINKIVDALVENVEGQIVEIGPGKGALTKTIFERGLNNLTLIEIDPEMAAYLKNNLPTYADYKIIEADFTKLDTARVLPSGPLTFISNLPYIDAAEILLKVLDIPSFKAAVFMFQREQALKLIAKPETKHYGPLSVIFQAYASAQQIARVSPGSFNPPPKVDSEVLLIRPLQKPFFTSLKHKENFKQVVKAVFGYRRKTVLNSLCEVYKKPKDDLIRILNKSDIQASARPEEISPRKYAQLAANLEGCKTSKTYETLG
ncbi:MAG: 16S rRNA (adenine(1518)-N(6)/adenine(1519)-N(6))-dimethyltransferase RsmA [Elusimicrobiota bacterium]|jgi:16S rRNA (adenine1518-N6/adenine1519-N6)-dimethyltransferase|nr:16S rRNA (adenine(1518)-N(6)/adenine(1519)-N(6))-dimethyltransferase RsmA [Elusimicrobiota bacterium]